MNKFKTISAVEPELVSLLEDTARMGAVNALIAVGELNQYINKTEAYKRFSRRKVDLWIQQGVIKVTEAGIDRTQLEAIAASANLATYVHTKVLK